MQIRGNDIDYAETEHNDDNCKDSSSESNLSIAEKASTPSVSGEEIISDDVTSASLSEKSSTSVRNTSESKTIKNIKVWTCFFFFI